MDTAKCILWFLLNQIRALERSLLGLQPTKPPTSRSKICYNKTLHSYCKNLRTYSVCLKLSTSGVTVLARSPPPLAQAKFPGAGERNARGQPVRRPKASSESGSRTHRAVPRESASRTRGASRRRVSSTGAGKTPAATGQDGARHRREARCAPGELGRRKGGCAPPALPRPPASPATYR